MAIIKKRKQHKQGIFRPNHPEKYKGTYPIIYRSSLELKAMRWFDSNPAVISWGSESVIIPYINPLTGKTSRYFTDMNVTIQTKQGIQKFLVEIKPFQQTVSPQKPKRGITKTYLKQSAEYLKNCAKWQAATKWSAQKNYNFIILTEKHLK